MIDRYTREEIGQIWSYENRLEQMLRVEKAVALVQSEAGLIPKSAGQAINKKGSFSVKQIQRIESKTKHDVTAFVKSVAQSVGDSAGKYVHYRLTSSDVLDTALSLQIIQSSQIINTQLESFKKALKKLLVKHKKTLCAGRTHGMHAEPTTFGFKLLSFLTEIDRAEKTFIQACKENARGAISGPVGNYSQLSEQIEKRVCRKLGLHSEDVSTQVIPRDRHARIIFSMSLILSCLERLALEFRHLQRTEVGEVAEGFSKTQEGSSAMPHKKNPISSENVTGLSRLLRSHLQCAQENIALWHERDISHSSVERVIFPDSFILCDYALYRMTEVLKYLQVYPKQMQTNLLTSGGGIFSAQVLSFLVSKGVTRSKAYKWIQQVSHSKQGNLKECLNESNPWNLCFKPKEIESLFSGDKIRARIFKVIDNKLKAL